MELDPIKLALLGLLASVVAEALKYVFKWIGVPINTLVVTIVVYVVSALLSILWLAPQLPPWTGDPAAFISALIEIAATVLGFAMIIYNVLLKWVLDRLGLAFAKRAG